MYLGGINMTHSQCKDLFSAGRKLLEGSRLTCYCGGCFVTGEAQNAIERYWRENIDPQFGRYMAWVWFSVGAENLVKAALVCDGIIEDEPKNLGYPVYSPDQDKQSWVEMVLHPGKNTQGTLGSKEAQKHEFGTMGDIWRKKLDLLSISPAEGRDLKAAYRYLTDVVRNRDAHTYVKEQRFKDFQAVEGVFLPAFNILVQTMRNKGHFQSVADA